MDYEKKEDVSLKNKKLKKKIINEYIYIVLIILILYISLPFLFEYMIGDNKGIDGIGQALAIGILLNIVKYIFTFIFCVVNPIRIFILYKNEIKKISSKVKKNIYTITIFFPILLAILIILEVPISNYLYTLKYETGKNDYTISQENYKMPIDFYNELNERKLLFNENTSKIMNRLNGNHNSNNYIHIGEEMISQKC